MTLSFQLRRPIRFDAYTIEESLAHILVNEVAKRKPRVIVEFGSGLSTVLMAKVIEVVGFECKFLSFEEDERYKKRTDAWLKAEGLAERANVVHAPIDYECEVPWYRGGNQLLPLLPSENAFVFVDGPRSPGKIEHCRSQWIRMPGLWLTAYLWCQRGSAAIVDDTVRDASTVERWKKEFHDAKWTDLGTERGALLVESREEPKTPDEDAIASAA